MYPGDASTVDDLQPWGDTSWSNKAPRIATDSSDQKTLAFRVINNEDIVFSIEIEGEPSQILNSLARLLVQFSNASTRETEFSRLPLALPSLMVSNKRVIRHATPVLLHDAPQDLEEEIRHLFATSKGDIFEDGMESDFSRSLVELIGMYGEPAIEILARLITSESVNTEVISEALRWIGRIEDSKTHESRLRLLERCLYSPSARVRDGAALGLASLDDPSATSYLKIAFEREKIGQLRENIKQVLEQLAETEMETSL